MSGHWSYGYNNELTDANGGSVTVTDPTAWVSGAKAGSLVAMIGGGIPFLAGNKVDIKSSDRRGELLLTMDDNDYSGNNTGSIKVAVTVHHNKRLSEQDQNAISATESALTVAAQSSTPNPLEEQNVYIKGVVIASVLNVRSEPSATAELMGKLGKNAQVAVLGRNEAGDWLQVPFKDTTGWVAAKFVNVQTPLEEIPVVP